MHAFSIVSQGSQTEAEKGDLALQVLNVPEVSKLRNIKGIDRSVLAEQVMPDPKFDRDLEKLVFVRAPTIEGPVKVTGTVQAAMQAIRQYVASSHAPLKAQLLKSTPYSAFI
jgi:glutamine amidotransferase PdxT